MASPFGLNPDVTLSATQAICANALIEFGDAFDYSGSDFASWCRESGFRDSEIIPLTGPSSDAVAYK